MGVRYIQKWGNYELENYKIRIDALNLGIDILERKLSLKLYQASIKQDDETFNYWLQQYQEAKEQHGELFAEARMFNKSQYKKTRRLTIRTQRIIDTGNSMFLTMTFKPSVLETTNEKTRRIYVTRFLKSLNAIYVANIDYGKKNEREHYHAIVSIAWVNHKSWKYGNLDFEKVYIKDKTTEKLAKYLAKLTKHAIKHTTKGRRLMYSRPIKTSACSTLNLTQEIT